MKYTALVFKNLIRSKRRTFLTVLSIAVSLFIFSALVSIPTVANEILGNTASSTRIATHNKAGLAYSIPVAYKQRIMAVPHVEVVVPESWFGGVYHEVYDQFPNLAADPEDVDKMWPDWGISAEQFEQFKKIRTAALVGGDTMKRFHLHVGQQIQLKGTLYPFNVTLQIVGTIGGKAPPDFLLFRRDYLEEAAGRPGIVDNIWVKVDKPENVPQVIAAIDEGFSNSSAETLSESEAAFIGSFMQQYRTFFKMAELLGIYRGADDRTGGGEYGGDVDKGAARGNSGDAVDRIQVADDIVAAAGGVLLIGLIGGVIGCGSAYLVLKGFSIGNMGGPLGAIRMPPTVLAETLVVAALIGLLSAIVPASSAARRNIVDALRTVA